VWSLACMVFEMLTDDFLFDPKADDGGFSREDDHLAQMQELQGKMPKWMATEGTKSPELRGGAAV
jgi:serine/threonine-protein kinase SRPK3